MVEPIALDEHQPPVVPAGASLIFVVLVAAFVEVLPHALSRAAARATKWAKRKLTTIFRLAGFRHDNSLRMWVSSSSGRAMIFAGQT